MAKRSPGLSNIAKALFGILIVLTVWAIKLAAIYSLSSIATWIVWKCFGLEWTLLVPVGALVIYAFIIGGIKWQVSKQNS